MYYSCKDIFFALVGIYYVDELPLGCSYNPQVSFYYVFDLSGKDIYISIECSESEFNSDLEVDWSSILYPLQPLPQDIIITKLSIDSIEISHERKDIPLEVSQNECQALTKSKKQHGLYFHIAVNDVRNHCPHYDFKPNRYISQELQV